MNVNYDSDRRNRRSIRLPGYDYSRAGAYFVTVCTHDRTLLFGEISNGEMRLNDSGRLVHEIWDGLPEHYLHVELDAFVIMPNHIHGIIFLTPGSGVMGAGMNGDDVSNSGSGGSRAGFKPAPTRHGLPEVVRAFKTFSARRINEYRQTPGTAVWQRDYYEHIIRNECDLNRIRQYIIDNPAKWPEDPDNPGSNPGSGSQRPVGASFKPAPTRHGLPEVVRAFKTFSARRINEYRQTPGTAVWQRNYYEHIIRNECDLNRIRQYIIDNPAKWPEDPDNPGSNPGPVHNAR